ncbi:MAG: nucleotide-diphospho-sugar transferase [Bacteroidota bacterium]
MKHPYKTKSPILLVLFNRADKAQKLLSHIKQVAPPQLFIAVDGPREGNEQDKVGIEANRKLLDFIDWDCEVKTLFQEKNLGVGKGPATAISWFFDHVESGIILEDDCMPNLSFFKFCDELLERYKDDTRVMQISGTNFLKGWKREEEYSYYFSEVGSCWGWASWARAWKHYDFYAKSIPEMVKKGYTKEFFFSHILERIANDPNLDKDAWDFQWDYAKFLQSGLSIVPNTNTVLNIGLGDDSTHSFDSEKYHFENNEPLEFPLKHPPFVIKDVVSDQRYFKEFWQKSRAHRLKQKIKKVLPTEFLTVSKMLMSIW